MIEQSPTLMNPKLIGQTQQETEQFRATSQNFANKQVSSASREFVSQDDDYEYCPNCSRKFFSGRLQLHLKSCKEGKPLKPIKAKPLAGNTQQQRETPIPVNKAVETLQHKNYLRERMDIPEQEEVLDPSFGDHTPVRSPQKVSNMSAAKSPLQKEKELDEYDGYPIRGNSGNKENFENEDDEEDNQARSPANFGENAMQADDGERVSCAVCGRSFHPDRIEKHEKVCKKSNKKRPVFDTTKQRLVPEQAELVRPGKKAPIQKKATAEAVTEENQGKEEQPKKVPAWKADHENFIQNIRFNRKLKEMEAKGEDTSGLVAPTIVNENYVPCPHCSRKFAPATAERHIPKCKNTFNRPKPPKNLKIDKLEETTQPRNERIDKSKTQFILRKGPRRGSELEKGSVTPTTSSGQGNFNINNPSHRSPQSTLSTGNYEQQVEEVMKDKLTPKDANKMMSRTQTRLPLKKTNSVEYSKQNALPEIRKQEMLESHELKFQETRTRDFRSQSPGKEEKKVFMEPMPKKDELLQNYQGLHSRATNYSTEACPHCQRKFSKHAAERHIPVCKDVNSRLPRKNPERDLSAGAKAKMYATNFGTKIGFRNKSGEKEDPANPRPGIHTTNYDQFQPEKMKASDRPPLPGKRTGGDGEGPGADKPPLKPKMNTTATTLCTSCGCKTGMSHKFCGNCGTKK